MAASIATISIDSERGAIAVAFTDGEERVISLSDLSEAMQLQLALHGLNQKLRDSYSGFGRKYGIEAVDMAKSTVDRTIETLKAGEWSARQGSGGGARMSIWVEALAEVLNVDVGEAAQRYADLGKEAKAAVRGHPDVKRAKVRLEAERADKEGDADAPDLSSLMG